MTETKAKNDAVARVELELRELIEAIEAIKEMHLEAIKEMHQTLKGIGKGDAPQSEFLLRDEVAKRLRVSPETVRRWEQDGKLTSYKAGRYILYRREDVDNLPRRRRRRPTATKGSQWYTDRITPENLHEHTDLTPVGPEEL